MTAWKLYQRRLLDMHGEEVLAYDIGRIDGEQTSVIGPNAVDCPRCKRKAPNSCATESGLDSDHPHMERIMAMNRELTRLRALRGAE